jgi:hypothetical protein
VAPSLSHSRCDPARPQVKLTLMDKLRDRPSGFYGAPCRGQPLQRPNAAEP